MFIEGEAVEGESSIAGRPDENNDAVRRLLHELEVTQSRLKTTREESEAANEELRAANEELQSINEEYRSTAEELETSKEELQSINEELQTVNTELRLKLEAISRAHSDLSNLMAATDFGTLFLDTDLRIKLFTERVTELFSITEADEGRPITDFAHRLDYADLVADARAVLADLVPVRREVRSQDGQWYDMRLRPYRTMEDKIDGVVITFVDISEQLRVEAALRVSEQELLQEKRLVELSHEPIFVWDLDGGIVTWNRGSEELYGYSREEALGQRKERLLHTEVPGSSFGALKAELLQTGYWAGELRHGTKDGQELTVEARLQLETFDNRRLVLESTRDITERKASEEQQRLLLNELNHRVRNSLAVVQSMAHQTLRSGGDREEAIARFNGRLAALASAHSLLTELDWQGADFAALARHQLDPYITNGAARVQMDGPSVLLPADLATPFGLVLHELATNAAKHGALSKDAGTVELRWDIRLRNGRPSLDVTWREVGGPPPKQRRTEGLGTKMIDMSIPNATVRRTFRRAGLECRIVVPLPEDAEGGAQPS